MASLSIIMADAYIVLPDWHYAPGEPEYPERIPMQEVWHHEVTSLLSLRQLILHHVGCICLYIYIYICIYVCM